MSPATTQAAPPVQSSGCIVAADDGYVDVTVSPPDAPAFELDVFATMQVELGGERDGLVSVSAPLAFVADLRTRRFRAAQSLELLGGMVHVGPASFLTDVRGDREGVIATVRVYGDVVAEVRDLAIPCEAIVLDDDDARADVEPAKPPVARTSRWGPRGDTVTFRAGPGEGATAAVTFPEGRRGAFDEIARRGRFHHLVVHSSDAWIVGWVDERELVRAVPGREQTDVLYGPSRVPAPPGGYSGPAKVAAGTPVYAADGGVGQWAVVSADTVFDVVVAKGASWIALTGTTRDGRTIRTYSLELLGHAWIPANAVEFVTPSRHRHAAGDHDAD